MKKIFQATQLITDSPAYDGSEAETYRTIRLDIVWRENKGAEKKVYITAQKHKDKENQHWSVWYGTKIMQDSIKLDYYYSGNGTENHGADFAKMIQKFRDKIYQNGASFESSFDAVLGFLKSNKCEPTHKAEL